MIIEFTVFILKNVYIVKLPLNVSKHSKIHHNYHDNCLSRLLLGQTG